MGGATLPAGIAACAACHGPLGEGSREGAQFAPSLRGANFAAAPDWVRAATLGLRHDGGALAQAMPRYRL
ncbi:MAG: c-type cytochrome, partial [Burkholderiaceae bacterium]